MESTVNDSRLLKPFMPSLAHLASVRIAISFTKEFNDMTLRKVFKEILHPSESLNEKNEDQKEPSRLKERILFIPPHLRSGLWEAINGIQFSLHRFIKDHGSFPLNECVFYYKSDGTVNRIKVVQELVQNENINIQKRFEIACIYCLEETIQTLWFEIEASGEAEKFRAGASSLCRFWIKRIHEKSQLPWAQAISKYIESLESPSKPLPTISSFFHLVQPGDRKKCVTFLEDSTLEDFRLCLRAMTKEEELQKAKIHPYVVLNLYWQWPLKGLFLETAEKMWDFLDPESFPMKMVCLGASIYYNKYYEHYHELLEAFWYKCPKHLRESVPGNRMTDLFNKLKNKRKQDDEFSVSSLFKKRFALYTENRK